MLRQKGRDETRHGGVEIGGPAHDADVGKFRLPFAREMAQDARAQSFGAFAANATA